MTWNPTVSFIHDRTEVMLTGRRADRIMTMGSGRQVSRVLVEIETTDPNEPTCKKWVDIAELYQISTIPPESFESLVSVISSVNGHTGPPAV